MRSVRLLPRTSRSVHLPLDRHCSSHPSDHCDRGRIQKEKMPQLQSKIQKGRQMLHQLRVSVKKIIPNSQQRKDLQQKENRIYGAMIHRLWASHRLPLHLFIYKHFRILRDCFLILQQSLLSQNFLNKILQELFSDLADDINQICHGCIWLYSATAVSIVLCLGRPEMTLNGGILYE